MIKYDQRKFRGETVKLPTYGQIILAHHGEDQQIRREQIKREKTRREKIRLSEMLEVVKRYVSQHICALAGPEGRLAKVVDLEGCLGMSGGQEAKSARGLGVKHSLKSKTQKQSKPHQPWKSLEHFCTMRCSKSACGLGTKHMVGRTFANPKCETN